MKTANLFLKMKDDFWKRKLENIIAVSIDTLSSNNIK